MSTGDTALVHSWHTSCYNLTGFMSLRGCQCFWFVSREKEKSFSTASDGASGNKIINMEKIKLLQVLPTDWEKNPQQNFPAPRAS